MLHASSELTLIIGFIVMLLFSLYFLKKKTESFYLPAFLVTSSTTLSYLIMISNEWAELSIFDENIYYTRWLFYAFSCSILMLSISKILKTKKEYISSIVFLNIMVMLTGFFAAISISHFKWLIFGLGCLFFVAQIKLLFEKSKSKHLKLIKNYVFLGWSAFPIVFILGPEGLSLISLFHSLAIYLILDIITKIVFYLQMSRLKV